MIGIRNINPQFGGRLVFTGETLREAKMRMASTVSVHGSAFHVSPERLEEGRDYEVAGWRPGARLKIAFTIILWTIAIGVPLALILRALRPHG